MKRWIPLLLLMPFVELMVLFQVGGELGFVPTVAIIVGTAMVGFSLARREGLKVLYECQAAFARGEQPAEGLLEAGIVLVGGILLMTPGFIADAVGLALLFRPVRLLVARRLRRDVVIRDGNATVIQPRPRETASSGGPSPEAWDRVKKQRPAAFGEEDALTSDEPK